MEDVNLAEERRPEVAIPAVHEKQSKMN